MSTMNETIILTGVIFQVLASIIYTFKVIPMQIKEMRIKDGIRLGRFLIPLGTLVFMSIGYFYLLASFIRYFLPPIPTSLVVLVFAFNGIGNFIVILIIDFLYTKKYYETIDEIDKKPSN